MTKSWPTLRGLLPLIGIVLFCGVTASPAQNLVRNGDLKEAARGESDAEGWELRVPFSGVREEKPGTPGEYCLTLFANEDDQGVFWIQKDLPLQPGVYRLTYQVMGEPGQKFRAYVESWTTDDVARESLAENTEVQTAAGEWEERSVLFRYPPGHKPPYLALQIEGPGKIHFADLSVTREE